jgi:hypothetical protein
VRFYIVCVPFLRVNMYFSWLKYITGFNFAFVEKFLIHVVSTNVAGCGTTHDVNLGDDGR